MAASSRVRPRRSTARASSRSPGKGFGFLREAKRSFVQTPADIFVTPEVCRKYNLRDGQWIKGEVRRSSRGPQLFRLTQLNGEDVEKYQSLPNFDELTTINPRKRIKLETVADRYTTRVMDLMTPIGKGQRGLIVAPPRTGKTTLLQHIAEAVVVNHPEMKLIILLVDERPEEVTEIRRSVPQAEIMASSNDSDLKSHVRIAQLAMERCKRLVEAGQHVFMLLDSITRMARAFNNTMSGNRGTQSGGLSVGALEIPRKIFRHRAQHGGSRQPDDHGHGAHRDEQQDGRRDLPGVQGNRATWNWCWTARSATSAFTRRWTSSCPARGARNCCSRVGNWTRST